MTKYFHRLFQNTTVLLACVTFFTACSSHASAESFLQKQIASQSGGNIVLTNFLKTNGIAGESGGVKTYQLFYKAKIKFIADGTWLSGGWGVNFKFTSQKAARGSLDALFAGSSGEIPVHSGNQATIEGDILAEKTEGGWEFRMGDCRITEQPK